MLTIRNPLGNEQIDLEEFEERVRRGEIRPDTEILFPAVAGERWVRAGDLEVFRGLYDPVRVYFTRYFRLSRFPVVTTIVILVNLLVFTAMALSFPRTGTHYSIEAMVAFGAKTPPLIADLGQWWRLLTASFVHRDILHLAFNMFVLFNVGGALENTFRPVQYLTLLLVSALGTTILSLVASDSVSAGASGVVFGCLGGLVVFGLKYREIIPVRYRSFFGAAVAPYVMVFLWMGWVSSGIDNWGHLGGLIAGTAATALLRPRLLATKPRRKGGDALLAASLAGITLAIVFGGYCLADHTRRTAVYRHDVSGAVIVHPKGWRRVVTSLGELGLGNGLPNPVWVQARCELVEPPVDLSIVADRWLADQLHVAEQVGRVRSSRWRAMQPVTVAGLPALVYEAAFEVIERDEWSVDHVLRLYVFARGDLVYSIAVGGPVRRFDAYAPLLDEMIGALRLEEPRFLRRARAALLLSPEDPLVRERLDYALTRAGEREN